MSQLSHGQRYYPLRDENDSKIVDVTDKYQVTYDLGTALVYTSFVLVLYREGLSGNILIFGLIVGVLFVLSLKYLQNELVVM